MVGTNYNDQNLIDQNVDIVATLTNKLEIVETAALVYVNVFDFWGEPTRNWFLPFSLAHLECPLTTYKSLKSNEGITEQWTY
ncbi:unnamed protein product [Allacma fusca]|uniref:Uncharacterized protein n=1 Tax=Allacma fusca TaxID=39272 RepID=A0A8J2KKG2_9HEXA|nr:unnamed protein product [Allacma fusca]